MAADLTVHDAMIECGLSDTVADMYNGQTPAERVAEDCFNDDFESCLDKTFEELDDDLKMYRSLQPGQGQLLVTPGIKKNLRAFIQWSRDCIRLSEDPESTPFPVGQASDLLRRYKTHQRFISDSKTLSEAAKPDKFKPNDKWDEWSSTFLNYLRTIPGRDGVPLKYVCREEEDPKLTAHDDFLDDYVDRASLEGTAFTIDSAHVHTLLINFITGNDIAEAKVQAITDECNGRKDFILLKEHYEGVGVHAIDIKEADDALTNLFYSGEKAPTMWWDRFEKELTRAFNAYVKKEKRIVHSEQMKLRILQGKIKADFLQNTKASVEVEIAKLPMNITYDQALGLYRNAVNSKFPPHTRQRDVRTRRVINETSRKTQGGRGRGGRGRNAATRHTPHRTRTDSRMITLIDGQEIEYHPSFNFPNHVFRKMKPIDKEMLVKERKAYKQQQSLQRQVKELQSRLDNTISSSMTDAVGNTVPRLVANSGEMSTSQITTQTSIMGGRNEQSQARRNIGQVTTRKSRVASTNVLSKIEEPIPGTESMNEMDSNADTCCLGSNFIVLQVTNRVADVYAYDTSLAPIQNVPIVTGATAYDDDDGVTRILVINEGLYYGKRLDHSLINPNQLRACGTPVWDNPYDPNRRLIIEADSRLTIPLHTRGTKIRFPSRAPTRQELETCEHVVLTSPYGWDPSAVDMSIQLQTLSQDQQVDWYIHDQTVGKTLYAEPDSDKASLHQICNVLVDLPLLLSKVEAEPYLSEEYPARRWYADPSRHNKANALTISNTFMIGPKRAQRTLRVTTQRGVRSAILPISRRYRADRMFDLPTLRGKFSTDTAFGRKRSLRQNIGAQVYSHKCGFKKAYPIPKVDGDNVGDTLAEFILEYGIPEHLTFDGASFQVGRSTRFMQLIRKHAIKYHTSAPYRPNENPAESAIHEIKKRWYRVMIKKQVPPRLWDYGFEWVCETNNVCSSFSRYCEGRTPLEIITGETPDISEYLDFGFYDWVTFRSNAGVGPVEIGRWLGVSHRVGRSMSYWILPRSGQPISASTVQRLTDSERAIDEWVTRMEDFDHAIKERLTIKHDDTPVDLTEIPDYQILDSEHEDPEFYAEFTRVIGDAQLGHADLAVDRDTGELRDSYLDMELSLPVQGGEDWMKARVVKRMRDEEGNPVGTAHDNPLLDTRAYEVQYIDGTNEILSANTIAENLLSQVDDEGHRQLLFDEIIDHRVLSHAIPKGQGTFRTKNGNLHRVRTTRGWEILIQWKDGSTDWVELKDVKDSNPVELARYARDLQLLEEPAFAWWAPNVLRKAHVIIGKIKSKYWSRTHKYGIRVPKNVREAIEIDKENGNTLWMDAVRLEMSNVRVAFEEFDGDVESLVGYTGITGHLVFDIKLGENFRRKARYCADGHKTGAPASVTYSTVVSRDSVRIVLLLAALNGLKVLGADVQNAFLTAPNREKIWLRAGPEFGDDEGKIFLVVRALYGLKSASFSFRAFAAEKLETLGYRSSPADPDVWLRPASKGDGEEYYEYVLAYVDDILCVSEDPEATLGALQRFMRFKNDKIEAPTQYLGARLNQKVVNGIACWTITSLDYIKACIQNVEETLRKKGKRLPTGVKTPMTMNYTPELDGTAELMGDDITYYQELIGMLRWATELGRVDILLEISLLSQYQASPREGHMEQLLRIFAYLKGKPKLTLYMNPELPRIDYGEFKTDRTTFSEYYRDAEEQLPHNMPRPRGRTLTMTAFVDASHGANKRTRRSHSGYVIFLNRAPVVWYSKRQSTVETSAFSSEFIAMRACLESIQFLRYKLRMFGVSLEKGKPTHVFCDNESVVRNTSEVQSTLHKKHSAIAYHHSRWAVAAGIISVAWIPSGQNLADAFTKRLPDVLRNQLFGDWTY